MLILSHLPTLEEFFLAHGILTRQPRVVRPFHRRIFRAITQWVAGTLPGGARLIPFYLGILQQRIVSEKTLNFGTYLGTGCTASDEARRLGHDNSTDKVVEHPGAAALFFALAEIDVNTMPEWGGRCGRGKRGCAADPVGGY